MGEAAALASALAWAGTSVGMARLSTRYSGAVLSGLRFLIASPVVIALMLATGGGPELAGAAPRAVGAIALSAAIGYGIGDTTYVRALPRVGLQRMAPTTTALFVASSAIGGVLLLDERAGWALLVGGAGVIAGTYLIVASRVERLPDPAAPRRLGLAATALVLTIVAGCWTTATLLLAGGRGDLGALPVSAIRIPAGGLTIAIGTAIASRGEVVRRLPSGADLWLMVALGLGGTAVGSVLYIYGVTEAGAARAVILNSTSPLMVVPLSMYFLGERPTRLIGAGTALCVLGTLVLMAFG
ncbi:MAG: DMT family transporter [Dehalococcoidia bacterium]|nr:DMT family transporter [Dehalococcoidia bacterium]